MLTEKIGTPAGVEALKSLFEEVLASNEEMRREIRSAYLDRKKLRSRLATSQKTIQAFQDERARHLDDLERMKEGLLKIEVTAAGEEVRDLARRARLGW